VKTLALVALLLTVTACTAADHQGTGSAPLRGFSIDVDQAISDRLPTVHLKTCGTWGCTEQDVPLSIAGPTSAAPCASPSAAPAAACGLVNLPGPGPGFGYAPVPRLTAASVTVTLTTPPGAPLPLTAHLQVHPALICPDNTATRCPDGVPQAHLHLAADNTLTQTHR
jgi:hypothetical protein